MLRAIPEAALERREAVAQAWKGACLTEVRAPKPGNVSVYAHGHGMSAEDFVASAEAAAGPLTKPGASVGERILGAVEATHQQVGCNTNLGIILLAAPLVHAALQAPPGGSLREALRRALSGLSGTDAQLAYRAIRLANPGGLGSSPRHDVRDEPQVTLLEAMREAQRRDRIARQYATAYQDVFEFGVPRARAVLARWAAEEWAAVAVYLGLLARMTDTHVARKRGVGVARGVSREALPLDTELMGCREPQAMLGRLLAWDRRLKRRGINPGTTADLTVASLLAVRLEDRLIQEFAGCQGVPWSVGSEVGLRSAVS